MTTGTSEITGIILNISGTGLFVATLSAMPMGKRVSVKFALPAGTVMTRARVTRLRHSSDGVTPGIAVTFEDLHELDRGLIATYCGEELKAVVRS